MGSGYSPCLTVIGCTYCLHSPACPVLSTLYHWMQPSVGAAPCLCLCVTSKVLCRRCETQPAGRGGTGDGEADGRRVRRVCYQWGGHASHCRCVVITCMTPQDSSIVSVNCPACNFSFVPELLCI